MPSQNRLNLDRFSTRWLAVMASEVVSLLAFLVLYPRSGVATTTFSALPVIVMGWAFGSRAGLITGVLSLLVNILLLSVLAQSSWHSILWYGTPGFTIIILAGVVVGRLHDLGEKLKQELSERKRTEAALKQEEERFRYVVLATHDAIYDWDICEKVVVRNDAYQKLFTPDTPLKIDEKWWEDSLHPEERTRVLDGLNAAFQNKLNFWSDEYRMRRYDGAYAVVMDRGYILYDANKQPVRMIGAITDITERKQVEEALLKSEEGLRQIVDSAFEAYVIQVQGIMIEVNEAFCELYGSPREEIIGTPSLERVAPESLELQSGPPAKRWHAL
jgi:PAS domain S-box-containing protein